MKFSLHAPQTIGAMAGWTGGAFLIGIALHSLIPYQTIDLFAISVATMCAILLLFIGWKSLWMRVIGVCLLAIVLGLWRFDSVRSSLPRGLIPFSSKGLAYASNSVTISNPEDPRYWLGHGRVWLTERANKIFPPDQAALLTGILYGERGFSKTLKDEFRRAGLLHIVAVSGSNVTIIVVMIMPVLLGLRLPRRFAFIGLSLALIAFVLFVNPYASVMRAAVMGWLIEFAPLVGRIPKPSRLLLIAAVVFTVWQPWALFYDASFALSFLAMAGLLIWTPWFDEQLKKWISWTSVRTILAASLGATLMTIPYTAWAFGQLTLLGVLTSLLALPLVPWIMGLGTLALLSPVFILTLPARGFLQLLLLVAHLPTIIPFGAWSHLSTSFTTLVVSYGVLYLFWSWIQRKKRLIHEANDSFPVPMSSNTRLSDISDEI
ncbi:ComEC/Rec2 family competence protein [Candidatus Uhrbacteria bacterium]|nr:ComEC/Rec2 family competence protein [Candidatus Uhrbacteria bacterium]